MVRRLYFFHAKVSTHCIPKAMKEQNTISLNSIQKSRFFFTCFFFACCAKLIAQPGINIYAELGQNNISQGLYLKSAAIGSYRFGSNVLSTGIQTNLDKNDKNLLSGYTINVSRYLTLQRMLLEWEGFFTMTDLSEILHETDWGFLMKMRRSHFEMEIGSNFKTYSFSEQARKEYNIMSDAVSIKETFNIIYSFRYNIKPSDNKWNLGWAITDIDYFQFNQETNPIFKLDGYLRFSNKISITADLSYELAGFTNLAFGSFGLTFKTGLIWNF